MNVIGISGLEGAERFKRSLWPGCEEREYRICQGYDSAAALLVDGIPLAAAAEERFNREKHSPAFPTAAIAYCLQEAGLRLDDVDVLAHAFDYEPFRAAFRIDPITRRLFDETCSRSSLLSLVERNLQGFPAERVRFVNHHRAHAASAFYTSGFDDCLVVVADAMGEVHGTSVYRGGENGLECLAEMSALDSIGILYSLVTLHLGFDFNADEYKIMGLAPYGDPARFRSVFEQMVQLCPDGRIRIPPLRLNRTRDERENYGATREFLKGELIRPRHPEDDITQDHRDVAAALQECLDRVMLHICGRFGSAAGARRLALAGGVALNCTANGRLIKSGNFDDIYIQPAAGDDGSALGAALYCAAEKGEIRNVRIATPFLGPSYSSECIDQALAAFRERIRIQRYPDLDGACKAAARLIAQGRVVAWYRGRMEFGPRALGHRSILADPGCPSMRDRINAMVKMREAFRPFAPAVSLEQVHRWFQVPPQTHLPYMITTVDVRPEIRAQLPAVTHVDGSARVQTVSAGDNAEFHALLKAVGDVTGREMVLNTSFNIKGQPIVNTPAQAIETFLGTGIEYLFLDNIQVSRSGEALDGVQ